MKRTAKTAKKSPAKRAAKVTPKRTLKVTPVKGKEKDARPAPDPRGEKALAAFLKGATQAEVARELQVYDSHARVIIARAAGIDDVHAPKGKAAFGALKAKSDGARGARRPFANGAKAAKAA